MYPNTEQQELLGKYFGCTRFVYNYFLNERMEQYKTTQKSVKPEAHKSLVCG